MMYLLKFFWSSRRGSKYFLKVVSETMQKYVPPYMRAGGIIAHKIRPKTITLSFKCSRCDYESDDAGNCQRHKRKHNRFNCPYCSFKTISRSKFDHHKESHKCDAPFHCHKCNFITAVADDLIRHRKIHFGDYPHYCPLCKATFKIKEKLEEHIRRHVGEKPFACRDCHLTFSFESSVIRHQEANRCSKNFKSFNQSSSLIAVGPTKGRKSIYGSDKNLVNFKKRGNTANNEKPGSVGQKSDLLFRKSRVLENGSTTSFPDNSNLGGITQFKKFIRIPALLPKDVLMKLAIPEDNPKPKNRFTVTQKDPTTAHVFNCVFCPRSFSKFSILDRHIRAHTKERPFACSLCSFTTAWYENLPGHHRTMHTSSVHLQDEQSQKIRFRRSEDEIVCEFCDAKVSTTFEHLDHLRHHTGQTLYKCTQSGCQFKTLDKKLYDCHSCDHVQYIS
ncbi:unnamed protein product [Allacma fusca]|uniref:C2H2-type domain-containing protein n=1 Tax=Allacma fusca TaxID=39272 RepID=A0A8J2L546_9HEXA|nr:unnamed protein product [Allacma fusca]